jgi:hypothetical protein
VCLNIRIKEASYRSMEIVSRLDIGRQFENEEESRPQLLRTGVVEACLNREGNWPRENESLASAGITSASR